MYTRVFNKMTADDIQAYLDRGGNTLFIGVGVVEVHGAMPIDVEQILPEAVAVLLAEKNDGLAMINIPYCFPGGTIISPATVHVSVRESMEHLMVILRSVIAQGFRKIFLVSGHGPARLYCDAVCRDIFQETKVHVCHIGNFLAFAEKKETMEEAFEDMDEMGVGAYKIMHQLEYLKVDPNAPDPEPVVGDPDNPVGRLIKALVPFESPISIIFGSPKDHGSGRAFRSEEERFEKATRGEQKLRALVDKMDLSEAMKALDEYQVYIAEMQEKYPRLKGLY